MFDTKLPSNSFFQLRGKKFGVKIQKITIMNIYCNKYPPIIHFHRFRPVNNGRDIIMVTDLIIC